jgi:hypothetical protein
MAEPRGQDRAVLTVAGVVLAVALAGAVVLLTGGGDDRATPAAGPQDAVTTATPTPSASPSATPTLSPPAAAPVPSPAGSSPPPQPPPGWDVATAYLSPEQADAVERPGWAVDGGHLPDERPLLDPCRSGAPPGAAAVAAQGERLMKSTRESGGSTLLQEVLRYDGPRQAASAFDQHLSDVAACPQAPAQDGPAGGTLRYEVVDRGDGQGVRTALVRLQPCSAEGGCADTYRSYVLLAQSAAGLTAAYYGQGEDGDPRPAATALLGAVADRLRATAG